MQTPIKSPQEMTQCNADKCSYVFDRDGRLRNVRGDDDLSLSPRRLREHEPLVRSGEQTVQWDHPVVRRRQLSVTDAAG